MFCAVYSSIFWNFVSHQTNGQWNLKNETKVNNLGFFESAVFFAQCNGTQCTRKKNFSVSFASGCRPFHERFAHEFKQYELRAINQESKITKHYMGRTCSWSVGANFWSVDILYYWIWTSLGHPCFGTRISCNGLRTKYGRGCARFSGLAFSAFSIMFVSKLVWRCWAFHYNSQTHSIALRCQK